MTQETKSNASNPPVEKQNKNLGALNEAQQQFEGSLDTIKEILLSEHAREIHMKMSVLEERVSRELESIQNHAARRFDSLESFMRKELLLLRDDIKREHEERAQSIDQAMGELKSSSKAFEQKITNANQQTSSRFSELRDQMFNQSQSLSEEILQRFRAIQEEIEKTTTGLESRKPDRQFIAGLLLRMAGALQAEPLTEAESNVAEFKTKATKKSG